MDGVLHGYTITDSTWLYHSLLLILAVFFRFSRVFSIRNVDLFLLLLISPMVLLAGDLISNPLLVTYTCVLSGLLLLRFLFDGLFQRRPKLEQNLNVSGLVFLCVSAFAFLMTNVFTSDVPTSSLDTVKQGKNLVKRVDSEEIDPDESEAAPVPSILAAGVTSLSKSVSTQVEPAEIPEDPVEIEEIEKQIEKKEAKLSAQLLAVFAHSAVLIGLILVGSRHFGDLQIGVAMATIYLLLPCTAYDVHRVNHVLPAAFIIWAVVAYRRPIVAGAMMGLACGTIFFTVFLAPVWATFYGRKGGGVKFVVATVLVATALMGTLVFTSSDTHSLQEQLIGHIKWEGLQFVGNPDAPEGTGLSNNIRIPIFAGFIVLLTVLTIWPKEKNLEHLLAHSTVIIVAAQLWYPQQTGLYVLWYLPMMLLVVFRPRLNRLLPPDTTEAAAADSRLPSPVLAGTNSRSALRSGLFQ